MKRKEVPMRSQLTIHEQRSVAQYNSNNAWLFNGNNGLLNNNNKYNNNEGRALDYYLRNFGRLKEFLDFAGEMYDAYKICRRTKRNSTAQLKFEYDNLRRIAVSMSVWAMEYVPAKSIAFIIEIPKRREVIAADFGDRVVQTWYNEKIKPEIEADWLDPDSYSCRKGRGGLNAVLNFQKKMEEATNGYVYDAWIIKRDVRAFFMSIDTAVLERYMTEFIEQHFGENYELRNRLLWLTRIIYRSLSQNNCVRKSHRLAWSRLDPRKSMFGKLIGLPIGNVAMQTGANFTSSIYLAKLRELGYDFCHYTDDTAIIVRNMDRWKRDEKQMEEFISNKLHLEWHPNKKYIQHISKGVEFLGFKIRYDRRLPSNRIAHNFIWKIQCAAKKAKEGQFMFDQAEEFMCIFNSYTGLLKWCNSNRLRNQAVEIIKQSKLADIYNITGNSKITIKKRKTRASYFAFLNRRRKREMFNLKTA